MGGPIARVIQNAPANVAYAAKTLTEHTENVIAKARADIEGMVNAHAERAGVDAPAARVQITAEDEP